MRPLPVIAILLLLSGCGAAGEPSDAVGALPEMTAAQVDAIFADIGADAPGCAVGTYRDGEILLTRSYGLASMEERRPITAQTSFDLGSGAKAFTALAVLMLEEQNRLSLDDDVRRYVPELRDYGTAIRIRDLLQHTSGLRDYHSLDLLADLATETTPDFLALLSRQARLNLAPGSRHEYSHSDFEFLGVIVERVVGAPFGAWLEREVLAPLGMTRSRVQDARRPPVPERAFGHLGPEAGSGALFNNSTLAGGSGLYTSIEELKHWDRALAEAGAGSRPLVARMLARPTLPDGDTIPYAYGIRTESYRGLPTLARGGRSNGTRTEYIRFPDQHFTVAVLCNGAHLWAGQLATRVAELYLGDVMEPSRAAHQPPPQAPLAAEVLARYVGVYGAAEDLEHTRIVSADGQLAELYGDSVLTYTHRGNGVFRHDDAPGDFRLVFEEDSSGGMRLSFMSEGEVEGTADRLPESELWRPTATDLASYAGIYASVELDAAWQLAVREGRLVLRRPGRADGPLVPFQPDQFSRHFGPSDEPLVVSFAFGRDPAGRVSHFTITTPPGENVVRELRFDRVAPR